MFEALLGRVRGRMRRRTFVLLVALSYAMLFLPLLLITFVPSVSAQLTPTLATLLALLNFAAIGFVYVSTAFITVKRLKDMNRSGKAAIMTLLPGGFLLLLWIATQPPVDNERGGNRYGRNPRVTGQERRGDQSARTEPSEAGASNGVRPKDIRPGDVKRGAEPSREQSKYVGRALYGGDGHARREVQRFS